MPRQKILFIAEAVTLAHVGRPLALAQALDPQRYELHFACAPGYEEFFKQSGLNHWAIHSIPGAQFLAALAAGKPVYQEQTLLGYVEDDLRLINELRPDRIVGDFRLSLSVSARVAGVPYIALINAYWSPYVAVRYQVPEIGLSKLLPLAVANSLFRAVRPLAFALHTRPMNRVRRRFGLDSLGYDLRTVYTDADRTCYTDIPQMFPANGLPAQHGYLGPVIWSPAIATPDWWEALPPETVVVYVTLGSSGQGRLLPLVLRALAPLQVTVIAATAGKITLDQVPANARVAPFLPGDAAARRARLVICNGGSPTSQQALAAGVPVLGIASNLDQFLNMQGVVAMGAGMLLRADRLSETVLRVAAADLLERAEAHAGAVTIARLFGQYDTARCLDAILSAHPGGAEQ
ncbi:glycosyltransferase [Oxalobacteraceae bacterium]|nr:glycosyltransferase [Oxalobacteraceae bacterium]